jgi:hypothetical protein
LVLAGLVYHRFEEATLSKTIVSFGSRPPSDGSAISWANSVFDEPLPISYRLLPISDLFTANFMANSGINFEAIEPVLDAFVKVSKPAYHLFLGPRVRKQL